MSESKSTSTYGTMDNINLYSIFRDILRNLWVILLGTLAAAMAANLIVSADYERSYTTSATFVVTSRSSGTMVYNNLSAAQTMATNFSNILNSDVLKKQVCNDLGMETFDAKASASVIAETNLLTLTVTADSPRKSYEVIRSIMRNYSNLTQYVTSNSIMQVLQNPDVPTGGRALQSVRRETAKYGMAAFALLVVGFGILSYLKTTVKSQKDMKNKLAAKPLGAVYYERTGVIRKKSRALMVNHVSASFDYVEQLQKLASKLIHTAEKEGAKVIVLTSKERREGKSLLAANFALSLGRQGKSVVLIDGNLRNPALHRLLHMDVGEGKSLSDYLTGESRLKEVLQYDPKKQLFLIGGSQTSNSAELLAQPEMEKLLRYLRKHFDYVLIDTPAMAGNADAEILSAHADMSLLVVQYDRVRAEDLNDAIDELVGPAMIPVYTILNQIRILPGERRVVGAYGSYGRYGKYGMYSRYGRYGRYGNYGKYGAYGHYGVKAEEEKKREDRRNIHNLEETLGKDRTGGEDA